MSVNVLLLSFLLLFDPGRVNHQTTTNGGVPSSPGGVNNDLGRPSSV